MQLLFGFLKVRHVLDVLLGLSNLEYGYFPLEYAPHSAAGPILAVCISDACMLEALARHLPSANRKLFGLYK